MADTLRWKAPSHERLEWRIWGEDSVVFDAASGNTHLLDPVAREGLQSLQETPATEDELCTRLAKRFDIAADEALQRYTAELIERLEALDLVTRVSHA